MPTGLFNLLVRYDTRRSDPPFYWSRQNLSNPRKDEISLLPQNFTEDKKMYILLYWTLLQSRRIINILNRSERRGVKKKKEFYSYYRRNDTITHLIVTTDIYWVITYRIFLCGSFNVGHDDKITIWNFLTQKTFGIIKYNILLRHNKNFSQLLRPHYTFVLP